MNIFYLIKKEGYRNTFPLARKGGECAIVEVQIKFMYIELFSFYTVDRIHKEPASFII